MKIPSWFQMAIPCLGDTTVSDRRGVATSPCVVRLKNSSGDGFAHRLRDVLLFCHAEFVSESYTAWMESVIV